PARRRRRVRAGARDRTRLRGRERRPAVDAGGPGGRALRARARGGGPTGRARVNVGLGSGRILVVDDEPQILRAVKASLRGAGYDVETAETAEAALTAAALSPPDAVILDLVLPDGRGTDVCRELRTWSTVPVIVLSVVGEES